MTEREKVINGLGKVWDAFNHMEHELYADYVYDALELLKDGKRVMKVVRCAYCRYWEPENAEGGVYSGHCKRSFGICYSQLTDASWFCADGEKVTGDA